MQVNYKFITEMHLKKGTKPRIGSAMLSNDGGYFVDLVGNQWPFTVKQAMAMYMLMKGGIEDYLRIFELVGVTRRKGWSVDEFFLVVDNMVAKLNIEGERFSLAKGKSVECGGCGIVLKSVPCEFCKRCDYTSGRRDQAYWGNPNSHDYVDTASVVSSQLSQYHGGSYFG